MSWIWILQGVTRLVLDYTDLWWQGDSGGPLWRNLEKEGEVRATQIGVVSRGRGCAGFNSPAIYGSVKQIHAWVRETVMKHKSNNNVCT